jgi:hypothetical protein
MGILLRKYSCTSDLKKIHQTNLGEVPLSLFCLFFLLNTAKCLYTDIIFGRFLRMIWMRDSPV